MGGRRRSYTQRRIRRTRRMRRKRMGRRSSNLDFLFPIIFIGIFIFIHFSDRFNISFGFLDNLSFGFLSGFSFGFLDYLVSFIIIAGLVIAIILLIVAIFLYRRAARRKLREIGSYEMILNAGSTIFKLGIKQSETGLPLYSVVDLDEGMSVTNAAADVIKVISGECGPIPDGAIVVYRDTNGTWDEIFVSGGKFKDFGHLGASSEDEALSIAVGKRPSQ